MIAKKEETKVIKKTKPVIKVNRDWCKGCRICVVFCPHAVLEMNGVYPEVVDIEACTRCMLCEARCPDFAITVE